MDRNFYDNDFEEFLKQKSDQYKMYPSDRVWNNVYSSLHGRKKWWALGFTLFFIGMGLLAGRHILLSDYNRIATQLNKETSTLLAASPSLKNIPSGTSHFFPSGNGIVQTANRHEAVPAAGNSILPINSRNIAAGSGVLPAATAANTSNVTAAAGGLETEAVITNEAVVVGIKAGTVQKQAAVQALPASVKDMAVKKEAGTPLKENKQKTAVIGAISHAYERAEGLKPSRWSLQVYASPTVSYRRLSNYDQQNSNHVPVSASYAADVNRYVNHRPAPGFEIGTNIQYKLSDNLSVFAGAQLNYSRYYINAFKYSREKTSIELEKAFVRDTLSGYTDIRNFSGYAPEQLQNKYLQLSVPVGVEIKLLGHKKLRFSVAGSVQPTFLLSSTSYLLSSDYKNYIQSPDLARTFNVHTNFEAFISYQAAGLKWQVGPQFRSQLLSSYSNQYRVREYLTEYGIKIGVSKTLR